MNSSTDTTSSQNISSSTPTRETRHKARPSAGASTGWFTFAGIMFFISGAANLLWGIGALDTKSYLPESGLLVSNLNTWGWISVVWGVVAICAALLLLLVRSESAAILGASLAAVSAVFWLFALPVLPIWSLLVIVIDAMVIYGLTAKNGGSQQIN